MPCVQMFILSILNSIWDYNKSVPKHVEKSMPKVPGWSTISGQFLKCGSVHTLMAKIAHNPLRLAKDSVQNYKHE